MSGREIIGSWLKLPIRQQPIAPAQNQFSTCTTTARVPGWLHGVHGFRSYKPNLMGLFNILELISNHTTSTESTQIVKLGGLGLNNLFGRGSLGF